jgi:hypothetical protein
MGELAFYLNTVKNPTGGLPLESESSEGWTKQRQDM